MCELQTWTLNYRYCFDTLEVRYDIDLVLSLLLIGCNDSGLYLTSHPYNGHPAFFLSDILVNFRPVRLIEITLVFAFV